MNVYTPSRYDERVFHLALGIEPRDANADSRLLSSVDVRLERYPRPVDRWRPWRAGETLTAFLPRLHRHRSGRFVRRYDEERGGFPPQVDVRIVDDRQRGSQRDPGQGRGIVPRRLRFPVTAEAVVLAAEADPNLPPHPIWRRTFPISCFPGSAAALASRATVVRGTVVTDPGTGVLEPVRWARVRARNNDGDDIGWAHGDERGEFVLVLAPAPGGVVVAADPVAVRLTVGAVLPPAAPDPVEPLLAEVDPLWDLPVEVVTASPTPATEPSITGRRFLPVHTQFVPLDPPQPIAVPAGRETSVVVRIG